MKLGTTYHALRNQIKELKSSHHLPDDETGFAYWFCQALLANPDNHSEIKQALVGGKDDRNIDILFISHAAKRVFICQTKYRKSLMKKNEPVNDVRAHAELAQLFAGSEKNLEDSVSNIKPDARVRLREAWKLIRRSDYSLDLFYATTGKISKQIREEAEQIVSAVKFPNGKKPDFMHFVYDGKACCRLFVDYQDLVPSIPHVNFEDISRRFLVEDRNEGLRSYVFPLPVRVLRRLFEVHGKRLFARNIRLWKGETITNQQIKDTLINQPHEFFYLNNGVTILASQVQAFGETRLRVFAPQIINGQQTTRTIAAFKNTLSQDTEVLVKVIWKEAETDKDVEALRDFIRRVVRSTNFQNKVSLSELAANDPEHITLDRAFRAMNWQYSRKKGKLDHDAGDTPAWAGQDKPYQTVSLQDLTTAMVACRLDPQWIRTNGIEKLFEDTNRHRYQNLFNERRTVDECMFAVLCSYLADKKIEDVDTWNRTVENYGVYYIAYCLHKLLLPLFKSAQNELLNRLGADKYAVNYDEPLWKLRKAVGLAWRQFVKGNIDQEQEVSAFISEYATKERWDRHWTSRNNKRRGPAKAALKAIERSLD